MTSLAIIPARYNSTRFPGKPLALLAGKPLIFWSYSNASEVFDRVVVATDDTRILDAVHDFGGAGVMTSGSHLSGTSRVNEAYHLIGAEADIIVNLQGDEPFVSASQIMRLIDCFDDDTVSIATLVTPFHQTPGGEQGGGATCSPQQYSTLADPNSVKVVLDHKGDAMFFSRSVIPYIRGAGPDCWTSIFDYYKHIGVYAFRPETLGALVGLPKASIESVESLEQLRWLYYGFRIRTAIVDGDNIGIDTPYDLEMANKRFISSI